MLLKRPQRAPSTRIVSLITPASHPRPGCFSSNIGRSLRAAPDKRKRIGTQRHESRGPHRCCRPHKKLASAYVRFTPESRHWRRTAKGVGTQPDESRAHIAFAPAPENFWRQTVPNVVGTASGRHWRAGDLLGLIRPTIHTNSLDRYNGASRVWHLQGVFEGFRRSGERKCSRRWHKKATCWLKLTSRKRPFVTGITLPIVDFSKTKNRGCAFPDP
jgi:hypothetical protein